MEEIIIIAGRDKHGVGRMRRCLRERGYHSIPCQSAEQIAREMQILVSSGACVPLVIVDREFLKELDDDLVGRMTHNVPDVPLLLVVKLSEPDDLVDVVEKVCEHGHQAGDRQNSVREHILDGLAARTGQS